MLNERLHQVADVCETSGHEAETLSFTECFYSCSTSYTDISLCKFVNAANNRWNPGENICHNNMKNISSHEKGFFC